MARQANHQSTRRQRTGRLGEDLAAAHLRAEGYQIKATNVRCATGEIDIVAQDKEGLVFVEVRAKASHRFGLPEESLNLRKRQRLVELAETYLQQQQEEPVSWRIDLIAIDLSPQGKLKRLEHIENAICE